MRAISTAFVLGAGLGTRLRPLTDKLPKPLIPVFQKPLITFAFDHLLAIGIRRIVVNTHHLPECYETTFPEKTYCSADLHFCHEPFLLETAGGIKNIEPFLNPEEALLVYNGDILTDLPLKPAIDLHLEQENLVTLILRSGEEPKKISWDPVSRQVIDICQKLFPKRQPNALFTGIYLVAPAFLKELQIGVRESVIPVFLRILERGGNIGGIVLDQGSWWDLGSRSAYLQVHSELEKNFAFPDFQTNSKVKLCREKIHPTASVHSSARLEGSTVVSANCVVGEGAVLQDTLLWPHAEVSPGTFLKDCIVSCGTVVSGNHVGSDL